MVRNLKLGLLFKSGSNTFDWESYIKGTTATLRISSTISQHAEEPFIHERGNLSTLRACLPVQQEVNDLVWVKYC
jgi:hypothetical protein